jgi:hypothetical protein
LSKANGAAEIDVMKFLPIIAAVLAAALFLPPKTFAAGKSKKVTPALNDLSDKISAVHLTSITVSVHSPAASKEYKVTPATKIIVNGQPSQLSGLATGMSVVVTPSPDGSTAVAIDAKAPRR